MIILCPSRWDIDCLIFPMPTLRSMVSPPSHRDMVQLWKHELMSVVVAGMHPKLAARIAAGNCKVGMCNGMFGGIRLGWITLWSGAAAQFGWFQECGMCQKRIGNAGTGSSEGWMQEGFDDATSLNEAISLMAFCFLVILWQNPPHHHYHHFLGRILLTPWDACRWVRLKLWIFRISDRPRDLPLPPCRCQLQGNPSQGRGHCPWRGTQPLNWWRYWDIKPVRIVEVSTPMGARCSCPVLFHVPHNLMSTLPETNIAPKNGWLEYYFPIGARPIFRGSCC